jgi:glycosyltransferase involved in cell wall biosynthesis
LRSLSIVIPAYNEENRLPQTLEKVVTYLSLRNLDFAEILVVDDGSRDRTAAVADQAAARWPVVRVLRNPGNWGKGYSVRHGMREARGEWALFSDADLSAPIEELSQLEQAAESQGAAVAIGSRALNRTLIGVHQSKLRETAGRFFNLVMRVTIGLPFWDTQCGFKLFRADAARRTFDRVRMERFGFDAEALFIARLHGFKIVEVPVRWSHADGTKVSMFTDSIDMFLDLIRVRLNQIRGYYR